MSLLLESKLQKMLESGNSSSFIEIKGIEHWAGNAEQANTVFEFIVSEFKKWNHKDYK
jgi:hypothetical protein